MTNRLIATRISQEAHSRLLKRCADLRCSPYEFLQTLVETAMREEVKPDEPAERGITITR